MQLSFKSINTYLLYCIVLSLPLFPKLLPPLIAFFTLSALGRIIQEKLRFKFNWPRVLSMVFFVLLIFGVIWSDNKPMAWFDLEVKLSLLIFPLVFSFIQLSKNELIFLVKIFIVGLVISSCVLLYDSTIAYTKSGSFQEYFYIYLSRKIHPSYLSMYFVLAVILILIGLKNEKFKFFQNDKLSLLLVIFFFILNLLILSKSGIIIACIIVGYFFIDWWLRSKKYMTGVIVLTTIIGSFYGMYKASTIVNKRVKELFSVFDDTPKNSDSSTSIRVKIWQEGLTVFSQRPIFGHGTGDVKDELMKRYEEVGMAVALEKKLNAHNQILQIAISVGLVGLFLFFAIFYFGLKEAWTAGNLFLLFFLLMSFLYILPESCLENQAGTIFFGLFLAVFSQTNHLFESISSNSQMT
jgi:O-antigen ligase